MRCESCDSVLRPSEMRDLEIETSSGVITVPEVFCLDCLRNYIYCVDSLDSRFYSHETLTEVGYTYFRKYSE